MDFYGTRWDRSVRGTWKLAEGDFGGSAFDGYRELSGLGILSLLLLFCFVSAPIALGLVLVFAYVGISSLTGGEYAWTAPGFSVVIGGSAAIAVAYGIRRIAKMDLGFRDSLSRISGHSSEYPKAIREAGTRAVESVKNGIEILTRSPEEIRTEAETRISEGIALRKSALGSPSYNSVPLPWIFLGAFSSLAYLERRVERLDRVGGHAEGEIRSFRPK